MQWVHFASRSREVAKYTNVVVVAEALALGSA